MEEMEQKQGPGYSEFRKTKLISRFTFHKPDEHGIENMRAIRRQVRSLADKIESLCPPGQEKEHALTQLQTVMMHANSAIVQIYPVDEKDV